MASITAHLTIAYRALAELRVDDAGAFLLGAVAPDSMPAEEKRITHYTERIDDRAYYRWDRFLDEHFQRDPDHRAYVLGYLCHLLADEEWDRYVRFSLFENPEYSGLPQETRLARYYADMSRIDVVIRPQLTERHTIAEGLAAADFPCIPTCLAAEQVQRCVEYARTDLFKEEAAAETQFLHAGVVVQMCASAVERTVKLCKCLVAAN